MTDRSLAIAAALDRAISSGLAGVAAVATDRNGAIYKGFAGVRVLGDNTPMTTDSVCAVFSVTKAMTATACLQLVESGALDLDAPAKRYAPELGTIEVIEGFDEAGQPRLRPPKRDITTRMLLLHTAGFGYDFYNETYLRLRKEFGHPDVASSTIAALRSPLLFDPGERWQYGTSIDWAGQVVEGITGKRLGAVLEEHLFAPLGMKDTSFTLTDSMRERLARIHRRQPDGTIAPMPDYELPQPPEVDMGGHGLYSTVEDVAAFLRLWLSDGMSPTGRLLQQETVEMAARDHLRGMKISPLSTVRPRAVCDLNFFPEMTKSWGLSFMINDENAPTGRSAGSLAWNGLSNTYYWIDRTRGIAGIWATQLFPFADPVAMSAYLDFETSVYGP